jgi:competence protein ComEA
MKWSHHILKEYLTFTRKDRIALFVIILIIVGIWIFPHVTKPTSSKTPPVDTSWINAVKNLEVTTEKSNPEKSNDQNINEFVYDKSAGDHSKDSKAELFYFDPNTLSLEGWHKLGIREKTIETIQKYLNKGGHFYKAEDLKKIYSLKPDEYIRIEPYIRIEIKSESSARIAITYHKEKPVYQSNHISVDINSADTSAFIALPGIGSKLAARIINFRDKLGGFYSVEQIRETYGLADSTFQKIKLFLKLETNSIKRININTATKDEMKVHPYLKWNLANAIVEYRNQHGNYTSLDDLKNITLITDEVFDKIKFYLTL